MTVRYEGNTVNAKQLVGFAIREQANIKLHAEAFNYGVLRRNMSFDNGAKLETLYLKGNIHTNIFYPLQEPQVKEVLKKIEELDISYFTVTLISAYTGYQGMYIIDSSGIENTTPLEVMLGVDIDAKFTKISDYFTEPSYDKIVESCCCIIKDSLSDKSFAYVASDNMFIPSASHKDDWHAYSFVFTSAGEFPGVDYWKTLYAPSFGIIGDIYLSHSRHTYLPHKKVHSLRSINQDKRSYCPNYTASIGTEYVIGSNIYGKQVDVGHIQISSIWNPSEPEYFYLLFWPFIPYMWEISACAIFNFAYSNWELSFVNVFDAWGSFRSWKLHTIDKETLKEKQTLLYEDTYSGDATSDPEHPANSTWNVSITKYLPIAPVGNDLTLYIETHISGGGGSSETVEPNTHSEDAGPDPATQALHGGDIEQTMGWWPLGNYYAYAQSIDSVGYGTANDLMVSQSLCVGSVVIDSGTGGMGYSASGTFYGGSEALTECDITQTDVGLPWYPNTVTWTVWDRATWDNRNGSGNFSRNLTLFEVLDYDSVYEYKNEEDYTHIIVVVYKKITVSHTIPRIMASVHESVQHLAEEVQWTHSSSDVMTPTGSRTAEYMLFVSVNGKEFRTPLNVSCSSSVSDGGVYPTHSGSGERCYGVVCKIVDKTVIVTYDKESFISTRGVPHAGGTYDGAYNFEDWNYFDGTPWGLGNGPLWKTDKRVICIFNFDDEENFGISLIDEQDPVDDEIYGVTLDKVEITID